MHKNNSFPQHLVRYGTIAEQRHITEQQKLFDALVINANMLAHASKAISMFLHKDMKKPYIIDPMTHAFQHDLDWIFNDKGELKSSIKKLVEQYGGMIKHAILDESRPINSKDITDSNISELVENVLDFQKNYVKEKLDDEYKEIIEFLGITREPYCLIIPYFYIKYENHKSLLDINSKCISEGIRQKVNFNSTPLFTQLVISRALLSDDNFIENAIDIYGQADGMMYWVDGFDEAKASEEELGKIANMVKKFKTKHANKPIVSLYGGYFSQLMTKIGLDGVVHGMEYGEKREVVPVGGGIPRAKFYIPAIHNRFDATAVIPLFTKFQVDSKKAYENNICTCQNCNKNIQDDSNGIEKIIEDFSVYLRTKPVQVNYKNGRKREIEFPIAESKEECLLHYLQVKEQEYNEINNKGLTPLLKQLAEAYDKHSISFEECGLDYLLKWQKVLLSV